MRSSFDKRSRSGQFGFADAAIEFHAPDDRKIITFRRVKQPVEQYFDCFLGRWFTWTHHAIDRYLCRHLVGGLVDPQGLRYICALIEIIRINSLNLFYICFVKFGKQGFRNLVVRKSQHFARFLIHDVVRQYPPQQKIFRHIQLINTGLLHFTNVLDRYPLVFLNDNLSAFRLNLESGNITTQSLRYQLQTE